MTEEYTDRIICGDCLNVMASMESDNIDSIVTDPPYGLSFMGKDWDHGVPGVPFWKQALRVAKPGSHLLAFGGTRTFHRLMVAIEDAGWEIRDTVMWVYGSGFPKTHNLKGEWEGWGTAFKPAWEPVVVARKPFKGTVAENVLKHGTGALNIDGCRVKRDCDDISGWSKSGSKASENRAMSGANYERAPKPDNPQGRWPANLIHDGSDEVTGLFSNDSARFFYCAKASKRERNAGCEGLEGKKRDESRKAEQPSMNGGVGNPYNRGAKPVVNHHPTVKPVALMRYLVRLVTPPGGVVLDPFCGSGSTGVAAIEEGFRFVGIDISAEYCEIARRRIGRAKEVNK